MLRLAKLNKKDVFYDLGCGKGQLCIIVVKEFNVRRAVGIDNHRGRVKQARKNVRKLGLQNRIKIRYRKIEDTDFGDATIVYCGLMEEENTLDKYEKILSDGCKLVMVAMPLISILSNRKEYPFYLMRFPFRKTKNEDVWASSVLLKKGTFNELLEEMKIDPDWRFDIQLIRKLARIRFA